MVNHTDGDFISLQAKKLVLAHHVQKITSYEPTDNKSNEDDKYGARNEKKGPAWLNS